MVARKNRGSPDALAQPELAIRKALVEPLAGIASRARLTLVG